MDRDATAENVGCVRHRTTASWYASAAMEASGSHASHRGSAIWSPTPSHVFQE